MTGLLSAEDRTLIERTRKVNKTLSMFVFAVQERSSIAEGVHCDIAYLLIELAEAIRERAAQQADDAAPDSAAIGASGNPLLALEAGRGTDIS